MHLHSPVNSESLALELLNKIEKSLIKRDYFTSYESDINLSVFIKLGDNNDFIKRANFHIDVLQHLDDKLNDKINNDINLSPDEKSTLTHDFLFEIRKRRTELFYLTELNKDLINYHENSTSPLSSDKIKSIRNKNLDLSDSNNSIKLNK